MFATLGPFGQFVNGSESEDFESACPFEINVDTRAVVDNQQVVTAGAKPIVLLGWRKVRWLKHRARLAFGTNLHHVVGCVRSHTSDIDAGEVVDEWCDGHRGCHRRIRIGHSTRQLLGGSLTTSQSFCSSSCLSSRSSVSPPPVRSAPSVSFFPFLSLLSPPAHLALGGDDVGDRPLFSGAGAPVARHCFFCFGLILLFRLALLVVVVCVMLVHVICLRVVLLPLVNQ